MFNKLKLKGIGKHNDLFIIILNVDRIFSVEKLIMVQPKEATNKRHAA